MNSSRNLASSLRLYLIVVIAFVLSLLFGYPIIAAPVIAVLTYLVMQYRRRNKDLEQRLGAIPQASSGSQDIPPPPEAPAPPMSTDA